MGDSAQAGGIHCETSTLRVLLEKAGLELSEPLLFGLGSGLSFVYWDSRSQPIPFVGGRTKPFEITRTVADRAGVELNVRETSSTRVAWQHASDAIDSGVPVGLQLDSYYLEYFSSRVHFAGHFAAMVGYDDERAHLVDTAQQGGRVTTSRSSLADARAARGPMSARNRSFTVGSLGEAGNDLSAPLVEAIVACADAYLTPPIANIGGRGVRTLGRKIPTWMDRVADPSVDLPLIASLMERAGTGGGLFRRIYRDFLIEARGLVAEDLVAGSADAIDRGIELFDESAREWTRAAELIDAAGRERDTRLLLDAGAVIAAIADTETTAMSHLRTLERRTV